MPRHLSADWGGNVLKALRATYRERESLDPHDLDQVGVMLETPDPEKPYFNVGIVAKDGKPTVEGIGVGDKPVQVDGLRLSSTTRGAVFSVLHGTAAAVRMLVLERDGKQVTLAAKTSAF